MPVSLSAEQDERAYLRFEQSCYILVVVNKMWTTAFLPCMIYLHGNRLLHRKEEKD